MNTGSRKRRLWPKGLIALAVVIIALLLAHTIFGLLAASALQGTQQAIAARHLPTTTEQIVPAPVAAADNAAPLLTQAIAIVNDDPEGKTGVAGLCRELEDWAVELAAWTPTKDPAHDLRRVTPAQKAEVREKLTKPELAPVFELLEAAAAKPACRFDLDYTQGPALQMPHLAKMRGFARLLAVRAYLRADEGDVAGAAADLGALLKLSQHLDRDPVLITELVSIAMSAIGTGNLNRLLDRGPDADLPAPAAASLDALLKRDGERFRPAMVRCFDGERILMGQYVFDGILTGRIRGADLDAMGVGMAGLRYFGSYPLRPLMRLDYRYYLEQLVAMRDRVAAPPAPGLAAPPPETKPPAYCMLSRLLLPALDRVVLKVTGAEAQTALARLGLLLAQYRREHAAYPDTLAALNAPAALTADPFSGHPLIYRKQGEGYVLYSVGINGQDDGGTNALKDNQPADLVWAITR